MSGAPQELLADPKNPGEYVLRRYDNAIRYYWASSARNKRLYKWSRYLVVGLGAAVTLLTSLSSSSLIVGTIWENVVAVSAPLAAAVLAIVGGLSQSFQWGAAWREMVMAAERLEKERDRIFVTESDPAKDLEVLNAYVLDESAGFFSRILGNVQPASHGGSDARG